MSCRKSFYMNIIKCKLNKSIEFFFFPEGNSSKGIRVTTVGSTRIESGVDGKQVLGGVYLDLWLL